jgi:hypothetical protein
MLEQQQQQAWQVAAIQTGLHGIFSISGLAKSRMIQEMTMARKNKKL